MACVAAIALSGCSEDAVSVALSEAVEDIDELDHWTNGETVPGMAAVGQRIGVDIMLPYKSYYDLGYVGVAPLESQCIVAFSLIGSSPEEGVLSAVVMSRFSYKLDTEALKSATLSEIGEFVDSQRAQCAVAPS